MFPGAPPAAGLLGGGQDDAFGVALDSSGGRRSATRRLRLSVLDQSPVRDGRTPAEAIRETLDLAQAADRLGYHRYWLAEHHSTPGLAGAAPEILIAEVAAARGGSASARAA